MDPGDLTGKIRRFEQLALAAAKERIDDAKVFTIGAPDVDSKYLALWITTQTDAQRDALSGDAGLKKALVAALHSVDYPPEAIPQVGFAFESEETVKREWGGDWWACIK